MPIYQLPGHFTVFPNPLLAHDSGVLAVGGDLSTDRLLLAYSFGIFPWYNEDQPIMWWFPDPRCVLFPRDLKISKSLRTTIRSGKFDVSLDRCFEEVVLRCREIPRKDQEGTWIHPEMIMAYTTLHNQGLAHSVEVWHEGRLAGGLYGVSLGRVFFGESMFTIVPDASKVALVHLAGKLKAWNFALIDCQQDTPHMRSMGATLIPASVFYHSYMVPNQKEILENAQDPVQLWTG